MLLGGCLEYILYGQYRGGTISEEKEKYNNQENLLQPAANNKVIAVAACNKTGSLWFDSNHNDKTIIAPGDSIVGVTSQGVLNNMSGTSVSTPIISAIAALKKSVDSNINYKELYLLLKKYNIN